MKISEAIKQLEFALKEVGDVEIIHVEEVDGQFYMEWDRSFEIIGIPDEDDTEEEMVVGFVNQNIIPEDEPSGPNLKRIK